MHQRDLDSLLPDGVSPVFNRWLNAYAVRLRLKAPRQTRLADFSVPGLGEIPTITLNTDLAPFQFMVTLTHEIAHLYTWYRHGSRVRPHGPEWRKEFRERLLELAAVKTLPTALRGALRKHARKPTSATHHDPHLLNTLRLLDGDDSLCLTDIPIGGQFLFRGRLFRKVKDARTRSRCVDQSSGIEYHISKVAPVERVPIARTEKPS
ncbi:MAG: SprT-like domain-containing protein [Myxococcota bacterium]|nr:SprT-like domain-containing protein [Myxococcota bacterium]